MKKLPRLRFAPSPTGSLHLGGLRTALFNHLLARKWGGKWLLRIEDTDRARLVKTSVDEIREGLAWAGLDYDEGPGAGGPHGSYFQSARLSIYHSHARVLINNNRAYRCFCDPTQLAATRLRLQKTGSNAGYDRTCLKLKPEEVTHFLSVNKPYCVRLLTADQPAQPSPDLVFGNPTPHPVPLDPIILKTDGYPTYHLASVVDDHLMDITHVVRGEEWLPSVPLHLSIYSAFGWKPPEFGHLPLLLNPGGSKMSKRTGKGAFVSEYMARGWEPEAVKNWLAIAGWGGQRDPHAPPDPTATPSFLDTEELISQFDLSHLTHRRTVLSQSKLAHLNKQHLAKKLAGETGRNELLARLGPLVRARFVQSPPVSEEYLERVLVGIQSRLTTLNDVLDAGAYLFEEPDYRGPEAEFLQLSVPSELYHSVIEKTIAELETLDPCNWTESHIKRALEAVQSKLEQVDTAAVDPSNVASHTPDSVDTGAAKIKHMKQMMSTLRHALTARKSGVSVAVSMELLGKERVLDRLAGRAKTSEAGSD